MTLDDILEARDLSEPRLSPDGASVAVVVSDAQGSYVHLISLADGSVRRLSDEPVRAGRGLGGGCLDWLPDSSGLVVVTKSNGLQQMSLGGETQPLLSIEGRTVGSPAVSPDGTSVAVVVDKPKSGRLISRPNKQLASMTAHMNLFLTQCGFKVRPYGRHGTRPICRGMKA